MHADRVVNRRPSRRKRKTRLPKITFFAVLLISAVLLVFLVGWLVDEVGALFGNPADDVPLGENPLYLAGQTYTTEYLQQKSLTITAGPLSVSLSGEKAGAPVSETELAAFIGQREENKSFFSQYKKLLSKHKVPFSVYDEAYVRAELEDLARRLNDGADPGFAIQGDGVRFFRGRSYVRFDMSAALAAVKAAFAKFSETPLALETTEAPLAMPDLAAIREKVFLPAADAHFVVGEDKNTVLVPEEIGRELDIAAVEAAYRQEDWTEKFFPFQVIAPAETTASLNAKYFQDVLATKETHYYESEINRTANVVLSAQAVDGTVIMPGETFSFNRVVGERTAARGYKEAKIYTSLGIEPGLGGGICQVSSTLYVTALLAELHQVTRWAHGYTVSYVDLGLDATIAWPTLDYVFRNTKPDPVKLSVSCQNGKLRITLLGTKTGDERDISFVTNVLNSVEPEIRETLDDSKEPGFYQLTSKGSRGYETETFKIAKVNGKIVEQVRINTSRYSPYRGTAIVGPAPEIEPEIPETPETLPENPTD